MNVPTASQCVVIVAVVLGVGRPAQAQQVRVDAKIPVYEKSRDGVSGKIRSAGSDSMNNLMAYWAEGFRKQYPNIEIEVEGKGSATAPAALIAGTAQLGPMSRAMKDTEIDQFESKYDYKPTALPASLDMLAVYVHQDNPLASLTLQQLDTIFSKTRKAGGDKEIKTWGDLGLAGTWANKPISLYGRNSASGTYSFFKDQVLLNGDYKDFVQEQPGSSAVVQAIASDKYGIGYSGIGAKTADVRTVPLARTANSKPVEAAPQNAYSPDYPLTRFLYVYVNYKPNSDLDPLRREFIKYLYSQEGQETVIKDGYYPVTPGVRAKALASVGINETMNDKR
jgi:phosphate transport system substrate-binding protein